MVFMFWMLAWLEQHGLGEKKKKKRQERQEKGFYGQAKGKMLHCSRGRRELFLFALKCSVWDRLFFFPFAFICFIPHIVIVQICICSMWDFICVLVLH